MNTRTGMFMLKDTFTTINTITIILTVIHTNMRTIAHMILITITTIIQTMTVTVIAIHINTMMLMDTTTRTATTCEESFCTCWP